MKQFAILMALLASLAAAPGANADEWYADKILVVKSERKMVLLADGKPMREYTISLGANPVGHKQEEGDERTPEGTYTIDFRNPESRFFRSLRISYPNDDDLRRAQERGVSPGGNIFIHGLANGYGLMSKLSKLANWTDGCIAVTNEEIMEIWNRVKLGTPIEIKP